MTTKQHESFRITRNPARAAGFIPVVRLPSAWTCAAVLLCAAAAYAQTPEPEPRGFSIGLRAQYNIQSPLLIAPVAPLPDGEIGITQSAWSAYKKFAYGPSIELSFNRKWSMTFEALYRRAGYDSEVIVFNSSRDIGDFQRTRATSWTLPFLARYYPAGRRRGKPRPFVFGGYARQRISGATHFSEQIRTDRTDPEQGTANALVRTSTGGFVLGGGLLFTDDLGIRIVPEARYTRWFNDVFESETVRMRAHQIEIGFALMF